ncbi:cupredoxin domain-containing protein, partial [Candidatus Protofrankia californiensis]
GRIRIDFSVPAGSAPHNAVLLDIAGARSPIISAGQSGSFAFEVRQPGEYRLVCTIHPNMLGTLAVG